MPHNWYDLRGISLRNILSDNLENLGGEELRICKGGTEVWELVVTLTESKEDPITPCGFEVTQLEARFFVKETQK